MTKHTKAPLCLEAEQQSAPCRGLCAVWVGALLCPQVLEH